jgi:hypothetical protein
MIKQFIKWLYFKDEKVTIIKIKSWNVFLIDKGCQRMTVSPVWDKYRIKDLLCRVFKCKDKKQITVLDTTNSYYTDTTWR